MPWGAGQAAKAPERGATRKHHRWSWYTERHCEVMQNADRLRQDYALRRIERKDTAFKKVPS